MKGQEAQGRFPLQVASSCAPRPTNSYPSSRSFGTHKFLDHRRNTETTTPVCARQLFSLITDNSRRFAQPHRRPGRCTGVPSYTSGFLDSGGRVNPLPDGGVRGDPGRAEHKIAGGSLEVDCCGHGLIIVHAAPTEVRISGQYRISCHAFSRCSFLAETFPKLTPPPSPRSPFPRSVFSLFVDP